VQIVPYNLWTGRILREGKRGAISENAANILIRLGIDDSQWLDMIGVSLRTLQNWEQNRRTPDGPARALLLVVKKNPMVVMEALGS
jgi:DNA-binding transcriptional regulator YiaG